MINMTLNPAVGWERKGTEPCPKTAGRTPLRVKDEYYDGALPCSADRCIVYGICDCAGCCKACKDSTYLPDFLRVVEEYCDDVTGEIIFTGDTISKSYYKYSEQGIADCDSGTGKEVFFECADEFIDVVEKRAKEERIRRG